MEFQNFDKIAFEDDGIHVYRRTGPATFQEFPNSPVKFEPNKWLSFWVEYTNENPVKFFVEVVNNAEGTDIYNLKFRNDVLGRLQAYEADAIGVNKKVWVVEFIGIGDVRIGRAFKHIVDMRGPEFGHRLYLTYTKDAQQLRTYFFSSKLKGIFNN